MSALRIFAVAFLALLVPTLVSAAAAQSATEAAPEPPGEAAYMQPLGRLAMILGSMHFLRKLCGDPQADVWRQKMQELIAAQDPAEAERKQLIASFNNGYRTFAATYRSCTGAARIAVNRYQQEGASLAREIGSRYGS
ncbi:TIGR02301 family protein [Jiella avicenniae]|uniref:TIGR02301 family protein n=1 Tax=Jiella avicenniae TaxID=2907202 RepID=A0A9X1P3J1_9HYPH|nr:TIGR02301 family protein [Jiella avicenniae]MCE7029204.1 TIGR02301 family protein [Jiella avicenniae]